MAGPSPATTGKRRTPYSVGCADKSENRLPTRVALPAGSLGDLGVRLLVGLRHRLVGTHLVFAVGAGCLLVLTTGALGNVRVGLLVGLRDHLLGAFAGFHFGLLLVSAVKRGEARTVPCVPGGSIAPTAGT